MRFGSLLPVIKALKAGGKSASDNMAPVPMEVWSSVTLAHPMVGKVAVPTTRMVVGGMYKGAVAGVP